MGEACKTISCFDRGTVAEVYEELRPFALSKTEYLVGNLEVAQDIVHDVFVRLWQMRLTFPSKRAVYSWVYASCHHAGIDYLRSKARTARLASADCLDRICDPKNSTDRVVNRQFVEQILGVLNEREALILAYKYVDGLTIKEMAELMTISERTIKRTLAHIQDKLIHLRSQSHE